MRKAGRHDLKMKLGNLLQVLQVLHAWILMTYAVTKLLQPVTKVLLNCKYLIINVLRCYSNVIATGSERHRFLESI